MDQEPLISIRQPERTGSKIDHALEHARLPAVIVQFESEGGGSRLISRVGRECFGRGIPMSCQSCIGVQEQEPITTGGFRARRELTATPSWGVDERSAVLLGYRFGKVARATVDDDDFSDSLYRSKRLSNGGGGIQSRNNNCKFQCDLALQPLKPAERGALPYRHRNQRRDPGQDSDSVALAKIPSKDPGADASSISVPAELAATTITLRSNQKLRDVIGFCTRTNDCRSWTGKVMKPRDKELLRTEVSVPRAVDAASHGNLNGGRPKFSDASLTAKGEARGEVPFNTLKTVWFNTGTLCNISCQGCYIESSPRNDRLAYLSRDEVRAFLDEAAFLSDEKLEIGFTGGEPFLNPDVMGMLEDSLRRRFRVLVLTNAMLPMQHHKPRLLELKRMFSGLLRIRVSIDHYEQAGHEKVRGPRTWDPALEGLRWLAREGFDLTIAGRLMWDETESGLRAGYAALFAREGISVAADDPNELVLFPEMKADDDVPEISQSCWAILGKSPADIMCASSRMIVKRKGAMRPVVVSCTILPYEAAFEMGSTLSEARLPVKLNHPNCARFCVLGGASCSHKT